MTDEAVGLTVAVNGLTADRGPMIGTRQDDIAAALIYAPAAPIKAWPRDAPRASEDDFVVALNPATAEVERGEEVVVKLNVTCDCYTHHVEDNGH